MREPSRRTFETLSGQSKTLEVAPLRFGDGRAALLRMSRIAAPALASGDIVGALRSVGEDDLTYFAEVFAKSTRLIAEDGKTPYIIGMVDALFQDEYAFFIEWLAFAAEYHFGPFVERLAATVRAKSAGPTNVNASD